MSPFRSEAQRRKFYSDPKLRKFIPEFEVDTPRTLPEHVPHKLSERVKQAHNKTRRK